MTQPNPNNTELEQQKSESQIAGLENQVEDNLANGKEKTDDSAAAGIEKNLDDAKSK